MSTTLGWKFHFAHLDSCHNWNIY